MNKKVYVLEHDPKETAGTIGDFMVSEDVRFERVRLFAGDRLPPIEEAAALVVLGGPMNVYEEDKYPFLRQEDAWIRQAVERRVPYLGICLGSQLLAKSMGARVYKGARPEVGWLPVRISEGARRDGLFAGLPSDELLVLQWHEDTFDLPDGAVHLASSPEVPNQAFSRDGLFHALQFHLEVDGPILRSWFAGHPDEGRILERYAAYRERLAPLAERVYRNFFSLIPERAGLR